MLEELQIGRSKKATKMSFEKNTAKKLIIHLSQMHVKLLLFSQKMIIKYNGVIKTLQKIVFSWFKNCTFRKICTFFPPQL